MIFIILLLGLVLRLINLNQSLWLDEAVQAVTSQGSLTGIFAELVGDFHPPLYHLLMWVWIHLFGSSEVVLRLPSVLFGIGTVLVVYKIGKLGKSGKLGLLGALFMATAPYHIYYSQEARMYALVTFFASLSMYWFIRLISQISLISQIGYIFATVLMLYTDYYGSLVLLAQVIATVVTLRRRVVSLFHCFIVSLLLFLPWLPFFFLQLKTGLQAIRDLRNWANLVNVEFFKALPLTFIKFTLGRITIFDKRIYTLVGLGILGIFGMIGGIGGMRWYRGGRREGKGPREDFYLVILLWLAVPILVAWLGSLFIPNYQPFRLLLVLPAFNLLLAIGISSLNSRFARFLALLFILITYHLSLITYYTNPYFHREDWRGVVGFIESQKEPSVALLPSVTSDWPWRYYSIGKVELIGASQRVKKVEEGEIINNLTMKQSNNETMIYYIRYLVDLFDPQELINQGLTEFGYVKIKEISFNQIPVWIYAYRD